MITIQLDYFKKHWLTGRNLVCLLFFVGLFVGGFLGTGLYFYLTGSKERTSQPPSVRYGRTNQEGEFSWDELNLLLIGHGGSGHPGGRLADTLMVVHLDSSQKKIVLISIPRDYSLDGQNKINTVFVDGPENAKEKVSRLTGLPVDYFVAVDFNQFQKIVDEIGGVTVDVPVAFDDPYYPVAGRELEPCGYTPQEIAALSARLSGFSLEKQFECRYERLHFEEGKQNMTGEVALKFVRSRHSGQHGGDFARHERQQAVIVGLVNRLVSLEAIKNVDDLYSRLDRLIMTDLSLEAVKKLARGVASPQEYQVKKVFLTEQNVLVSATSAKGAYLLLPKEGGGRSVADYIRKELN